MQANDFSMMLTDVVIVRAFSCRALYFGPDEVFGTLTLATANPLDPVRANLQEETG